MKVVELVESRRQNWRQLEEYCREFESGRARRSNPRKLSRFAALYRAACADLALADAYHLPPSTVHYLHQLVAQAHNQLYRSQRFQFAKWGRSLLWDVPRQLVADKCLWTAMLLFWGFFLLSMFLGSKYSPFPEFAESLVGRDQLEQLDDMYREPIKSEADFSSERSIMAGFYINHNTSIGLRCFAAGLLFGVGGLFETIFNACALGGMFGYMSQSPHRDNFFEFVTAHGPFELTAIVLSAAVGMRLGFALVFTHGLSRTDSVRQQAKIAMPAMGVAILLFGLAALIEGYISPSSLPYEVKFSVMMISSALLIIYIFVLGLWKERTDA